jgi:hypothetical protein
MKHKISMLKSRLQKLYGLAHEKLKENNRRIKCPKV